MVPENLFLSTLQQAISTITSLRRKYSARTTEDGDIDVLSAATIRHVELSESPESKICVFVLFFVISNTYEGQLITICRASVAGTDAEIKRARARAWKLSGSAGRQCMMAPLIQL